MPLAGHHEVAKGIKYTEAMDTGWRAPKKYANLSHEECEEIRKKFHIVVEGETCPPPIKKFKHMR